MSSDQEILKQVLAAPDHPHVWLLGETRRKISAKEARLFVRSESFAWSGTKRRVRAIRLLKEQPRWALCYRTTAAAVLPPSIEWCLSLRT